VNAIFTLYQRAFNWFLFHYFNICFFQVVFTAKILSGDSYLDHFMTHSLAVSLQGALYNCKELTCFDSLQNYHLRSGSFPLN